MIILNSLTHMCQTNLSVILWFTIRYERIASSADPDKIPHPAALIRIFFVLLGFHLMGAGIYYANAHSDIYYLVNVYPCYYV